MTTEQDEVYRRAIERRAENYEIIKSLDIPGAISLFGLITPLGLSLSCDGAADGLAKAIVRMQQFRDHLNGRSDVNTHNEWLSVKDNHVTVNVDIMPMGHIERFKVAFAHVGIYEEPEKE